MQLLLAFHLFYIFLIQTKKIGIWKIFLFSSSLSFLSETQKFFYSPNTSLNTCKICIRWVWLDNNINICLSTCIRINGDFSFSITSTGHINKSVYSFRIKITFLSLSLNINLKIRAKNVTIFISNLINKYIHQH